MFFFKIRQLYCAEKRISMHKAGLKKVWPD